MKEKDFDIKLWELLRAERERRHMTQSQVAEKLGVTKMTVSRWESGDRAMTAKRLLDYCNVIGVRADDVFAKMED
jgi:transcriptional regulator with XRE-family HTH domain